MPGHSLMGSVATFDSSRVTWPEKPGSIQPAVECVSNPSLPSELFDLVRGRENELTRMQHEWLVVGGLHQPGQIRLLDRRVDVGVPVVLEHPEVAVQSHVDAGWLDELGIVRIDFDPPRIDLGFDVTVGEQHARNLPVPVRCRGDGPVVRGDSAETRRCPVGPRGCSSMVERQLPKLIVGVRFSSPAQSVEAQVNSIFSNM